MTKQELNRLEELNYKFRRSWDEEKEVSELRSRRLDELEELANQRGYLTEDEDNEWDELHRIIWDENEADLREWSQM